MKLLSSALLSGLLLTGLATSCTIVRVGSHSGPPRIEAHGLIEGHAAVGILRENQLLHLGLLDGSNDGSIVEFGLWKLFRLELGFAGAAVSVGPLHVGVGVLQYEAPTPRMMSVDYTEADALAEAEAEARKRDGRIEGEFGFGLIRWSREMGGEEETEGHTECVGEPDENTDSPFEVDPSLVTED